MIPDLILLTIQFAYSKETNNTDFYFDAVMRLLFFFGRLKQIPVKLFHFPQRNHFNVEFIFP